MTRVFVTGVHSSGKTHFAKRYAEENNLKYVSLDKVFDYQSKEPQCRKILSELPPSFIMDAIPIDENYTWADFMEWEAQNDALVVWVYCPDQTEWLNRVRRKRPPGTILDRWKRIRELRGPRFEEVEAFLAGRRGLRRRLGSWSYKLKNMQRLLDSIDDEIALNDFRVFLMGNVPCLEQFSRVEFYDSMRNEYTSKEIALERLQHGRLTLQARLDGMDGLNYDTKYQDIEVIDFVGYSQSHETWDRIKDLVDWEGKTVTDLGCFHGYFSFKVEDSGGIVRGLDTSSVVLDTARMINELRGGNVAFELWSGGDDVPECDVILCLNSLHHFADRDKAVSKMNSSIAVFEINKEQRPIIEKYFHVVRVVESHRDNRVILLCDASIEGSNR